MRSFIVKTYDAIMPYQPIYQAMCAFTEHRDSTTQDELWLLQHQPVFTLGQQGARGHILTQTDIPVVSSNRGGHVTYHGPGQLVAYTLFDLKRRHSSVRQFVSLLEEVIIQQLFRLAITAYARPDAPGVYVQGDKIASVGLRVKKGCCYHGIAVNVAMDLMPFTYINPCGLTDVRMTHLKAFVPEITMAQASTLFVEAFNSVLNHVSPADSSY